MIFRVQNQIEELKRVATAENWISCLESQIKRGWRDISNKIRELEEDFGDLICKEAEFRWRKVGLGWEW